MRLLPTWSMSLSSGTNIKKLRKSYDSVPGISDQLLAS